VTINGINIIKYGVKVIDNIFIISPFLVYENIGQKSQFSDNCNASATMAINGIMVIMHGAKVIGNILSK